MFGCARVFEKRRFIRRGAKPIISLTAVWCVSARRCFARNIFVRQCPPVFFYFSWLVVFCRKTHFRLVKRAANCSRRALKYAAPRATNLKRREMYRAGTPYEYGRRMSVSTSNSFRRTNVFFFFFRLPIIYEYKSKISFAYRLICGWVGELSRLRERENDETKKRNL